MAWVPGGTFVAGSDAHHPEEGPARPVTVAGFWADRTPVTNEQFRRFVRESGYVTVAERTVRPGTPAGSAVFVDPAEAAANGSNGTNGSPGATGATGTPASPWWVRVAGADWRHPRGPQSSLRGCEDHPVVHVAWDDAVAFAGWAGRALPTEAEWERAARGGLDGAAYAWGDERTPGGRHVANVWQGVFPDRNDCVDGHRFTSPVYAFPPNGYGLRDVVGNVWEWTASRVPAGPWPAAPGCDDVGAAAPARGPWRRDGAAHIAKGGSHLCAPGTCGRFRPAARLALPPDATTSHLGFRCIVRS